MRRALGAEFNPESSDRAAIKTVGFSNLLNGIPAVESVTDLSELIGADFLAAHNLKSAA